MAWIIVATAKQSGKQPPTKEYFLVRVRDRNAALASLHRQRPDLLNVPCEIVGDTRVDWIDVLDKEVFCVTAVP